MLWIWIWEVFSCERGDIDAIVTKAKSYGVGVIVKTHDGASENPNGPSGPALVRALKSANVPVRAWGYCYPDVDANRQAAFAARTECEYIADVEIEYDGQPEAAQRLTEALREAMPTRRLGYSPLPIISYHDGGQYAAFNGLDFAAPQAYAGTGGRDAISVLNWTRTEWNRSFPNMEVEPAVYAADQDPEELRGAVALAKTLGNGDVSIWSWQHMADEHWEVLGKKEEVAFKDDPDAISYKQNVFDTFESIKTVINKMAVLLPAVKAEVDEAVRRLNKLKDI